MNHFLLLILFLFSTCYSYNQTTFYQSLDEGGDNIWGVQVTETTYGYAIIGLESCEQAGCSSWYLVDEAGSFQEKFTLFPGHERSIKPSSEGSYLLIDSTHYLTLTTSTIENETDILICSFDFDLQDTIWCKVFGDQLRDVPTQIIADGQKNIYAYHGRTLSDSPVLIITELIKLDSAGNTLWNVDIGIENSYNVNFNHLHLPNGDHLTFYAACELGANCLGFTGYGLYATRVDTAGQQLWSQELRRGYFSYWHGTDPVLLDDGLIALNWIHDTLPLPADSVRYQDMLIWMDQDGEIVREFFFPKDRARNIHSMTKATNGDIIGAGSVSLYDLELGQGGYVFRMSPNGTLRWERYLADVRFPIDNHFFNDVIEAEDGGIVLTGSLQDSFPNADPFPNNPNIWLVKLDSTGCLEPGCGRFQVMGTTVNTEEVHNSDNSLRLFPNPTASFTQLQWPPDTPLRYPLNVQVYDLAGRSILQRQFTQAPTVLQCQNWPPGYYAVHVRDQEGRQWVQKLVVR